MRACVLLLALSVTVCSAARMGPIEIPDSVLAVGSNFMSGMPSWLSHPFGLGEPGLNPTDFDQWKQVHGKTYDSEDEHQARYKIYQDNVRKINEHNRVDKDVKLAVNQFADITNEEFRNVYTPKTFDVNRARSSEFRHKDVEVDVKSALDWRTHGAVTQVKNQGGCGSCWAFSTTGSIEGLRAIKYGKLEQLSEQELVDCDTHKDMGCIGGLMDYAFKFIVDNGGIDAEKDYPYTAAVTGNLTCKFRKERNVVTKITGFEDVPPGDELALLKAVSQQPVSVVIEGDQLAFQFYSSGVLRQSHCGTKLDHAVLIVGYGTDHSNPISPVDYWIVKNSWGPLWGEEGYIRLSRHAFKNPGTCGIASQASYPLMDEDAQN